jgi:homeodomain-containing protein
MPKKSIVRLSAKERRTLREIVKQLNGSSQQVRRAQMLLKADVDGPAWTDERIAEAFDSRTRTVEKLRERFVTHGFESTLHGKPRDQPPTEKILSGQQEARVIAMRLGPPPKGYANWTLRLLARKVVELEIADSISHETVRRTLKKTG